MKLSNRDRWLTAGILFVANLPLLAASHLPTIVVSASRTEQTGIETPAGITVIERDEIERSDARNLQQLLQSRSGIQINSLYGDGSQATIDMRGFGPTAGSNTLILLDGRRLNNPSDIAAPDLNAIDLRRVARIEIVQGSAGTLYGNQAVGGMVNIITREPETFSAHIAAAAGSYDGREGYADIGNRLDNGLAYRFSAKRRISDNYRDNNETDRNDFNLRLDYEYARGDLFFEQQRIDHFQRLPGSLFADELSQNRRQSAAAYAGDFSDTETDVSRFGLRQQLGRYWSFEGELTHRDNDRKFQTGFRTFPGSLATQERTVKGFNPRFIGVYPMANGEARVTAGADLERTDYALQTSFGPTLLDQSVDAVYAQVTLPATERISVTAGFRRASVDNQIESFAGIDRLDDSERVGALGFSLQANDALRFFLRVDENFRFATVDEHTNPVFGQPVGLENQTGISHEAGVEWRRSGITAKLVIYRLDLDNEISFDASEFSNINLDETRREGSTLEGSWQVRPDITLNGSLTYTDPRITAGPFDGNRIPLVAARTGRLSGDWHPSPLWHLFAEGLFSGQRVMGGDFSNSFEELPGYGVVNLGSQFTTGPWRIGLRIDNLLDKEYSNTGAVGFDAGFTRRAAFFPAPERNLWLTLNYLIE
ncbi:MAG: TonB-dependent receptor [Candidatus Thiodiazotropha sp.]